MRLIALAGAMILLLVTQAHAASSLPCAKNARSIIARHAAVASGGFVGISAAEGFELDVNLYQYAVRVDLGNGAHHTYGIQLQYNPRNDMCSIAGIWLAESGY